MKNPVLEIVSIVYNYTAYGVAALQVKLLAREPTADDWTKLTVDVLAIYRRGHDRIARGQTLLWARTSDLACRCPRLRAKKTYAVLGRDTNGARGVAGLMLDGNGVVVKWSEGVARGMKDAVRYQQQKNC